MKRKVYHFKNTEDKPDCLCTLIFTLNNNSSLFTYTNIFTNINYDADNLEEEYFRANINDILDTIMFSFNNANITSRYDKFW